ncbi:MAG: hypothetical protein GY943_30465 [Chloroflexi bacterium]|nr:hypothetical protein [Chloroflexota bacterium]
MKVLIGCEYSGRVREAFRKIGHNAISCDLLPTEIEGPHYQGNILDILDNNWDMAIFFPDCTYLTVSGLHHNKRNPLRARKTREAIEFVETLWRAKINKVAIENPVGCLSTKSRLGKPSQIIQPWQFGENASKSTCLWTRGLMPIMPTALYPPRMVMTGEYAGKLRWGNQTDSGQNKLTPSPDRAKIRALTYQGIADAMASQWGDIRHSNEREAA